MSGKSHLNLVDSITVFKFKKPSTPKNDSKGKILHDADGDLILQRPSFTEESVTIVHSSYTDIESVGLQVWSAGLLLADFVIHNGDSMFANKNVLEIAAGVGIVSIVSAMYCNKVVCTETNEAKILKTVRSNVKNNKHIIAADIVVKDFNLFQQWSDDIRKILDSTNIIVVSEVIYDNDIIDGFVNQLINIFNSHSEIIVYMSVEKRYVFTTDNLHVEAKYYEYFFERLKSVQKISALQLETDFPQYFPSYERTKEIELWKIWVPEK